MYDMQLLLVDHIPQILEWVSFFTYYIIFNTAFTVLYFNQLQGLIGFIAQLMPFVDFDKSMFVHGETALDFLISTGLVQGVHCGLAFCHKPKLCAAVMSLHA
jgi:hypothetical protein